MKILFCGTSVPEEVEYQVRNISAAGNRFQKNIVYNLCDLGHEVNTISFVAMEIPKELRKEFGKENSENTNARIKNHYIFRQRNGCNAIFRALKECKEHTKACMETCDLVLCYNVFYCFLFVPNLSRKMKKKNTVILADYSGPESFRSIKGKLYAYVQRLIMRRYDKVIGLSANIQQNLRRKQEFVLIEGGIDESFYNQFTEKYVQNNEQTVFMYAGLLNKVTGVDVLLKVVMELEESNFQLWISGKGEMEEQIHDIAEKDKRVCYLGHMEYDKYIEALKKADVLINPRNMEIPENQNNFPSKIMDYLATGKKIISSKFVGWKNFEENIIFYDDTDMLKWEIKRFIRGECREMDVFEKNRRKAISYLWKNQMKRIIGDDL